jgi:hypothetical protein
MTGEPRDTPGLIAYRIEVLLSGRWYFWGYSPTAKPGTKYPLGESEYRSTALIAGR